MTTPTPDEFLAQPSEAEDEEVEQIDPLASIAESLSLRGLLTIAEAPTEDVRAQAADDYAELRLEYDEIEALHDRKQLLIEEVLEVCKPSTSKLANSIRAVLEAPVEPAQVGA